MLKQSRTGYSREEDPGDLTKQEEGVRTLESLSSDFCIFTLGLVAGIGFNLTGSRFSSNFNCLHCSVWCLD